MNKKKIGEFLVEKGILEAHQIPLVLSYSLQSGKRFCQSALEMKIITRASLVDAFAPGFKGKFFNLTANHLTKIPTDLIVMRDSLRHGAIPLGFKKESRLFRKNRRSNLVIGMLDPSGHTQAITAFREAVKGDRRARALSEPQIYLILVDQFLDVLENLHGVSVEMLQRMDPAELCPTLRDFVRPVVQFPRLKLVA